MAKNHIILPKDSKLGIAISLLVGFVFTIVGVLIHLGPLQIGQCEYLCLFGSCLISLHTCTQQDFLFWQTFFLFIGILCLILGFIALIRRKVN
ncbi:hypothetical protein FJZ18_00365 [Candidatus Pacearchaeota archaeon]|nr:hypothetical protein [Candidatus Pacearchaeota archaeon]